MDVSTQQVASVAAALIPFLERRCEPCLYWVRTCNVKRFLLRADKPVSGYRYGKTNRTWLGRMAVVAKRGGPVQYVDASRIVIKVNEDETVAGEAVSIFII